MQRDDNHAKRGRRIGLLIAGTGVAWLLITAFGASAGWSHRTLAFFDLVAIAGFALAVWMIYGLWRDGRKDKD